MLNSEHTAHLVGTKLGQYRIGEFVAGGAFGSFHFGYVSSTDQKKVAIKLEKKTAPLPQLVLEVTFYHSLGEVNFIPKMFYFGECPSDRNYHGMVMELGGPSLNEMRNKVGGQYSVWTTTNVMFQLIRIFNFVHDHGIIYRDVKPENFLIGPPNSPKWATVQLIDMGFCKYYLTEEHQHIPYIEGKPIAGTQRYMSINNHLGREISRRDDLEAILYMAVYLRKGQLPWRELQGNAMEKNRQTVAMKINTSPEELCVDMPRAFPEYLRTVRSLGFDQRPNYGRLMNMFYIELIRMGIKPEDQKVDWDIGHNPMTTF